MTVYISKNRRVFVSALKASRRHLAEAKASILETHCLFDRNLRPRVKTLDRVGRQALRPVERDLAKVDRALKLLGEAT